MLIFVKILIINLLLNTNNQDHLSTRGVNNHDDQLIEYGGAQNPNVLRDQPPGNHAIIKRAKAPFYADLLSGLSEMAL